MKQNVRIKTFETNSSSCHSIVISKSDMELDVARAKDITGEVGVDEFGWGYNEILDPLTIISYFYTLAMHLKDENKIKILKSAFPNVTFKEYPGEYEWEDYGYIDHDSIYNITFSEFYLRQAALYGTLIIANDNDDYGIYDRYPEDKFDRLYPQW